MTDAPDEEARRALTDREPATGRRVEQAAERVPDEVTNQVNDQVTYHVTGLDCVEEVSALRRALEDQAGVGQLLFDVLNGRMTVAYDGRVIDEPALRAAVARTGMRATPWTGGDELSGTATRGATLRTRLTLLSGMALLAAFAWHVQRSGLTGALQGRPPAASVTLYLLAILGGLTFVAPKALYALRALRPDMNLLMVVAVGGALALGEWFEGASVSFLFALSLMLESWSVGRARRAVAALVDLQPTEALVLHEGAHGDQAEHADGAHEHRMPADAVPLGARILVKPGQRLPLDGEVVAGRSGVDQSPITGESLPVDKSPGDEVFAGSVNGAGALEIRTTRAAGESTLARIRQLVSEAQSQRSASERFVERFARVYTPAILGLALLTWIVPPLLFGAEWNAWLYNALVLLVIACPCALVISTPVSIVSGLAAAARHGVLVKGGAYLEEAGHLVAMALDKTGTLTLGRPVVDRVLPLDDHTERGLLEVAAAIESASEHPLAAAIVDRARAQDVPVGRAERLVALPGRGVSAEIDGKAYWMGSHRYLEERGQETPAVHEQLEALEADGSTAVVLGNEDHVCGMLTLRDEPRPSARAAVAELRELGLAALVMLTGDNEGTARVIAREVGLDDVRAELLPEEKLRAVEELVSMHGHVAMVGDGVNDAPALARSSLGIAMGVAGTAAAIETADVVVLSDDLSRLPWLIAHARRTLSVIRWNIGVSLAVKAVFIALAIGGWSTLWGAIAADMGVSLVVVANALRLLTDPRSPRRIGS